MDVRSDGECEEEEDADKENVYTELCYISFKVYRYDITVFLCVCVFACICLPYVGVNFCYPFLFSFTFLFITL